MSPSFFQRSLSLALSVVLTVAMLGGIDQLSQHEEPPAQWAQQTSTQA